MKIPIFPGKYHQNGEFSMAMLVYRRVTFFLKCSKCFLPDDNDSVVLVGCFFSFPFLSACSHGEFSCPIAPPRTARSLCRNHPNGR